IARLMLSAGICCALASATALRSRGLPSTSPPPMRAAVVISLISLVKILPRTASLAPFFRLIVAHLEWPLIRPPIAKLGITHKAPMAFLGPPQSCCFSPVLGGGGVLRPRRQVR